MFRKINFLKLEKIPVIYLITILFLTTFILYGNSLFNGFVWDDEEQIVSNSIIKHVENISYLFKGSTFNTGGAGLGGFYYKPLMPLSFLINYAIWGENAFGFHFLQVIFHAINGLLLFILFKKLFDYQNLQFSKIIAFTLSLIFIVHPVNVESVAYISSVQEILYTFFLILSFLFVFSILRNTKLSLRNLILLNLFILLSLLSKESGVVGIPIIISFLFIFNKKKIIPVSISLSCTFLFYLFMRFGIAKVPVVTSTSIIPITKAPLLVRLQTIPFELASYIRLLFFPKDLFTSQHFVINTISDPRFYISLFVVIPFIAFLIFLLFKLKSKLYLFFFLWIVFSMSILLNIYPLDMTIAERWLYSPIIGFLGIFGILLSKILASNKIRATYIFIIILIIVSLFFARSMARTFDFKDNYTLFSNDIRFVEDSFDAQNNYGVALVRRGRFKEAVPHFQRSAELEPAWWTSFNNLGSARQIEGKPDEAKKMYEISIKNGNYYMAYENLAVLRLKTENPEKIIPFLKQALNILPYNETLNKVTAIAYFRTNATASAKFYAEKAFLINNSQENNLLLQEIMNAK